MRFLALLFPFLFNRRTTSGPMKLSGIPRGRARRYSLARHGHIKLGEFFSVKDFRCHDGTDEILITDELIAIAILMRLQFGVNNVHCGYRTPAHNRAVGGEVGPPPSRHVSGDAYDSDFRNATAKQAASYARYVLKVGGVGIYEWGVHLDCGRISTWGGTIPRWTGSTTIPAAHLAEVRRVLASLPV